MKPLPTHQFALATGVTICARPVAPDDACHLVALFAGMSPESRYLRFAKVLDHPDADRIRQEAEAIAAMSPEQGAAWIALATAPGEPPVPAGVVRYLLMSRDTAEVDIAVADSYQRCGIGAWLSQLLVEQARAAGIRQLTWVVQQGNNAMLCMLRKAPFPVKRRRAGDLIFVEAELEPADKATA